MSAPLSVLERHSASLSPPAPQSCLTSAWRGPRLGGDTERPPEVPERPWLIVGQIHLLESGPWTVQTEGSLCFLATFIEFFRCFLVTF